MEVEVTRTDILYPINGWRYEIEERTDQCGTEYRAWRIGIYENARKLPRLIAVCRNFGEAKVEAGKVHRRSVAASC
jgi:hypothetical protein